MTIYPHRIEDCQIGNGVGKEIYNCKLITACITYTKVLCFILIVNTQMRVFLKIIFQKGGYCTFKQYPLGN